MSTKGALLDARGAFHNHQMFSQLCGLTHVFTYDPLDRHPFNIRKLLMVQQLLKTHRTAIWVDADAFFVRPICPSSWNLTTHDVAFDIARDRDIRIRNTGVVAFHRGPTFERFLQLYNRTRLAWHDQTSDNALFNHILGLKRVMNVYPSGVTLDGWRRHVPGYAAFDAKNYNELSPRLNAFPQYRPCRKGREHMYKVQADSIILHFPGEYSGGSVIDGRINACAMQTVAHWYKRASHALDDVPRRVTKSHTPDVAIVTGIFPRYEL